MKKVLLLSCSTGQGHNFCAKAIKEYFELQNVVCEIRDSFDFFSERFAEFMSWGHSFMYRYVPGLFRWGYQYSEKHPDIFGDRSGIYRLLIAGAKSLRQYIVDGHYDTVICTHVFSAIMLTYIQKHFPLIVQTAFVATDYTCYPGMNACSLRKNFVSSEDQVYTYNKCGVPQSHTVATGIPIRRSFFQICEKADAKRQLQISDKNAHLLVMCGSMGCGPMKKILRHMARELPEQAEVSVICGANKRLYSSLNRKHGGNHRIHVVGYTDNISLYMDAADLYLTKPGGISVTEAAAKNLPMIFVDAVAGCEQYNMDFFLNMRAAVTANTPKRLAEKSIELLQTPAERRYMEDRLQEYRQSDGAAYIFEELSRAEKTVFQI